MTPEIVIAGALGLAAIVDDLVRRRISNWIPATALVAGIGYHVATRGWLGLGSATAGAVAGFLVFLIFYLLGGMGGGDVKLMGGFGAVLGIGRLLEGALFTAMIGGLIALAAVCWRAAARRLRKDAGEQKELKFIPYAPAIALGVWLALLPK